VLGAGLAGCEAAVQLARAGLEVDLLEMKPAVFSPAHRLAGPAELVCSNSLKSDAPDTAHGLLKRELRDLGSVVMQAADQTRVPAGTALAVDRQAFSDAMRAILAAHPRIHFQEGSKVDDFPPGEVILATGPLTSEPLAARLMALVGEEDLYFYDALAPIVEADSIDRQRVFAASRWGKGEPDYLNCPLNREEYGRLVAALLEAPRTPLREFEKAHYFESCLPVEVLAERGEDTLAFGPLRPVGLEVDGRRPYAVVQLRPENREKSAYNLVGFQTKLTQAAQAEVFRLIPGLEQARFLRYGAVHRNLYIDAPRVLNPRFGLTAEPRIRLAGQITGVEGYLESAAMGLLAGRQLAADLGGPAFLAPPADTALGALCAHLRGAGLQKRYEPMNIHFGLLPQAGGRGRRQKREKAIERARRAFAAWLERKD